MADPFRARLLLLFFLHSLALRGTSAVDRPGSSAKVSSIKTGEEFVEVGRFPRTGKGVIHVCVFKLIQPQRWEQGLGWDPSQLCKPPSAKEIAGSSAANGKLLGYPPVSWKQCSKVPLQFHQCTSWAHIISSFSWRTCRHACGSVVQLR
eukprot:1139751-Pelagomonas_calceolata.AAC.2